MQQETPTRLYRCADCISPKYADYHIAKGMPCRLCGSMRFHYAQPNRFYTTLWIFHQHEWSIFRKIKELFLVKVSAPEPEPKKVA